MVNERARLYLYTRVYPVRSAVRSARATMMNSVYRLLMADRVCDTMEYVFIIALSTIIRVLLYVQM
jgi:hypothetical protein